MHLNTRSLSNNFNNLTDLLACLDIKFSIIGISDTWLISECSHSTDDIEGYKFLHKQLQNRTGGEVALYVSNDLEFKHCDDQSFSKTDIVETPFIKIISPRENNVIVDIEYRPTNTKILTISCSQKTNYETRSAGRAKYTSSWGISCEFNELPTSLPCRSIPRCNVFKYVFPSIRSLANYATTLIDNICYEYFFRTFEKWSTIYWH